MDERPYEAVPAEKERSAARVIEAALAVHRTLGPGLLESAYESCLAYELRTAGFEVRTQVPVPIHYRGVRMRVDYRADLIVERRVLVEVKATETTLPVHGAQLLTYLRLTGLRVGLLVNFNVPLLRDGLKRVIL